MLEATLLVMESMPVDPSSPLQYSLSGHSGDSYDISLVPFDGVKPADEADKYGILEEMVAHSQYCISGDYTVRATEHAITSIVDSQDDEGTERYVIVVSDANFERYGIQASGLAAMMRKDSKVKAHLILIASLGGEAEQVVKEMAVCKGQVHTCYNTSDLPVIFQKILEEAIGGTLD